MSQELLKLAFDKAKKEIRSNKKTHLARHLSDTLEENYKYQINERTVRDYYNKLEKNDFSKQDDLKPKLIECLCQYLGYTNYAEFVNKHPDQTISEKGITGLEKTIRKKSKKTLKTKTLLSIVAGVILIASLIIWSGNQTNSPTDGSLECMTWAETTYIEYPCDKGPYSEWGTNIIPLNQHLLNNMKKVAVSASYTFFNEKNEPLVWYYKISDTEVEFYKSPGLHPTNGKTLKAVTEYIIEKYVPVHEPSKNSFVE